MIKVIEYVYACFGFIAAAVLVNIYLWQAPLPLQWLFWYLHLVGVVGAFLWFVYMIRWAHSARKDRK